MTRYLVWTLVHLCSYHEVNAPLSLSAVWIRERKTSTVGLNWLMWESVFWSDLRKQAIGVLENRLGTRTVFFAWSPSHSNTENSYTDSRWAVYLWKNPSETWMIDKYHGQIPQLVRNIWTGPHQFKFQRRDPFLQFFLSSWPIQSITISSVIKVLKDRSNRSACKI